MTEMDETRRGLQGREEEGKVRLETEGGTVDEKGEDASQAKGPRLGGDDIKFFLAMAVVTVGFTLRGGPMPGALWATLKGLGVCYFYGVGTAFLFIGVAKAVARIMNRTFSYDSVKFARWVFALAALFAVSQFFHEGYLVATGQLPR